MAATHGQLMLTPLYAGPVCWSCMLVLCADPVRWSCMLTLYAGPVC